MGLDEIPSGNLASSASWRVSPFAGLPDARVLKGLATTSLHSQTMPSCSARSEWPGAPSCLCRSGALE